MGFVAAKPINFLTKPMVGEDADSDDHTPATAHQLVCL